MVLATSLIDGTNIDDIVLGIVAFMVALTALAAASHKPPFRQAGQFIGWLFKRLVGEPLSKWYTKTLQQEVIPILDARFAPVVEQIEHLHECVERKGAEAVEAAREAKEAATESKIAVAEVKAVVDHHVEVMEEHVRADAESFSSTEEWRHGDLKEWQDSIDRKLANIRITQQEDSPNA